MSFYFCFLIKKERCAIRGVGSSRAIVEEGIRSIHFDDIFEAMACSFRVWATFLLFPRLDTEFSRIKTLPTFIFLCNFFCICCNSLYFVSFLLCVDGFKMLNAILLVHVVPTKIQYNPQPEVFILASFQILHNSPEYEPAKKWIFMMAF